MTSPINAMIGACVSCTMCGAKGVGTCDCWEPCPTQGCGWTRERGGACNNPVHCEATGKRPAIRRVTHASRHRRRP